MKWSQKLFLPILIVSAFLLNTASGGVPLPSPNPSQQAEGANTSKHQNPENPKPMQAVGRQSSSRPTAAEPEDYPSSLPIWFQVVTTLTLLGFTGGLWWVSYKQSQIAQKALQIAERAYVNVYEIKILGGKIVPGKFPEIMVGYKNSGRTPAVHLWVSTGMNHASKTIVPEDLPKTGRIDAGEDGWKGPKVGEILPPDVIRYRSATPYLPTPMVRLGLVNSITEEMISAINLREVYLCVWVAIDYEDSFGGVEAFFYDPDICAFQAAPSGSHQSD